jgi:tryptophan synthase alpha chain
MTEISDTFLELENKNEAALIAYVTVGDPNTKKTLRFVSALIEGGVDIVELGIPFSDPIADGPTIQNAVSRSLAGGCKPIDAFNVASSIRERHEIPLVAMTYFNPVFRMGIARFLTLGKKAGFSGLIIPDLPIEGSQSYRNACASKEVDTIFLAAPSTDESRLKRIASVTSGYLYLVSLYGVTGARNTLTQDSVKLVERCSNLLRDRLPFAVGFGISRPEQVRRLVRAGANGVIVGSAFVNIIAENIHNTPQASRKLQKLARTLKRETRMNQ